MRYFIKLKALFYVLTLAAAIASGASLAKAPDTTLDVLNLIDQHKTYLTDAKQEVQQIREQLQQPPDNDEILAGFRLQLDSLEKNLAENNNSLRTRLAEINSRLEQLGAPSEDQGEESAIVADERARLSVEKAGINALLSESDDASSELKKMITQISDLRRDLFKTTLSRRVGFENAFGFHMVRAAQNQLAEFGHLIQDWWRFVVTNKLGAFLIATLLASSVALFIQLWARKLLGPLYWRDPNVGAPPYLTRLSVAFWSTAIPSGAVATFLIITFFLFQFFGVIEAEVAILARSLFVVIGIVFFICRLAFVCISPSAPSWRLLPIAAKPGAALVGLISFIAVLNGIDSFFAVVNQVQAAPVSLTMAKSFILTWLVGLLFLTIAFVKPVEDGQVRKPWPKWFKLFLIALGLIPIIIASLGFIGLARFISQQIVVTGAFLVVIYLGLLTGRAISEERSFPTSQIGKLLKKRFHFDDTALDQLGLVFGILISLAVALIGIPLVLMQFGFQWVELKNTFYRLMTGFQIGGISISMVGLLTGIVFFILGFLLTRWFQSWLDNKVLARGRVDTGVRNSIRTVIGYVGMVLAALVAVSAAGFNLSSLALIAGGLSLGIGFGLQNIVQNFVSGLILLVERPFKVGDWVEAGGVSGTVKKISVRATEVETFQKQSIVVPNSSLINGNVGNWTLRNKLGRIEINVQTSYTEDPRRVHKVLTEIIAAHPSILKNPEPFVAFQNMSESVMVFDIFAFVADITSTGGIKNELRFQVVERFHEENIHLASTSSTLVLDLPEMEKLTEQVKPAEDSD